jgi:predicted DNA-binding transcriptional regulator AlpA
MPTRAIRRGRLKQIVPPADSTIHQMERRAEFPGRFALTRRCVVWDLGEAEAWPTARSSGWSSEASSRAASIFRRAVWSGIWKRSRDGSKSAKAYFEGRAKIASGPDV